MVQDKNRYIRNPNKTITALQDLTDFLFKAIYIIYNFDMNRSIQ